MKGGTSSFEDDGDCLLRLPSLSWHEGLPDHLMIWWWGENENFSKQSLFRVSEWLKFSQFSESEAWILNSVNRNFETVSSGIGPKNIVKDERTSKQSLKLSGRECRGRGGAGAEGLKYDTQTFPLKCGLHIWEPHILFVMQTSMLLLSK